MTTTIGLGILLLMQGNASEVLHATNGQHKVSPEYASTSESLYERCSIYNTMGYGNLLYKELMSLSFKADRDSEAMVHLFLTTYADSLSKTVGKESTVRVIDHFIQILPEVDHKARASEQLKLNNLNIQHTNVRSRAKSSAQTAEERLAQLEKQSKEWSAGRLYHLLAKKADLLADTDRKAEVIKELSAASSKMGDAFLYTRRIATLIRDLNLMGTPAPSVRFSDVLAEKRMFEITKGKVVILISSRSHGTNEWSRAKTKMPDLYAANKDQGLEVFTLIPHSDGVDKRYRDAVAQYRVDYGIQWPVVQSSLVQGPPLLNPPGSGVFFHPSNRSQLTIIDRKGVIRYVITEESDYNPGYAFEKVKEKVVRLLAE